MIQTTICPFCVKMNPEVLCLRSCIMNVSENWWKGVAFPCITALPFLFLTGSWSLIFVYLKIALWPGDTAGSKCGLQLCNFHLNHGRSRCLSKCQWALGASTTASLLAAVVAQETTEEKQRKSEFSRAWENDPCGLRTVFCFSQMLLRFNKTEGLGVVHSYWRV